MKIDVNSEGHDLLRALYLEDWLDYRVAECYAVLARYGMGLLELYEADPAAAMLAMDAGLMFIEWIETYTPPPAPSKRL